MCALSRDASRQVQRLTPGARVNGTHGLPHHRFASAGTAPMCPPAGQLPALQEPPPCTQLQKNGNLRGNVSRSILLEPCLLLTRALARGLPVRWSQRVAKKIKLVVTGPTPVCSTSQQQQTTYTCLSNRRLSRTYNNGLGFRLTFQATRAPVTRDVDPPACPPPLASEKRLTIFLQTPHDPTLALTPETSPAQATRPARNLPGRRQNEHPRYTSPGWGHTQCPGCSADHGPSGCR